MPQIAVRLSEQDLAALDAAVRAGSYSSRAEAVRSGIAGVLREERERAIADAYRRGYEREPEEERLGAAGLAAMAEVLGDEPVAEPR